MELIVENVRCFAGKHEIPIKPLTFLIGENSSGKSTFLAALATVYDYGYPLRPRFNDPPYNLGSYDTIATYKGGRYGRAEHFSLGYKEDEASNAVEGSKQVIASYTGRQGITEISLLSARTSSLSADIRLSHKNSKTLVTAEIRYKSKKHDFEAEIEEDNSAPLFRVWEDFVLSTTLRGRREFSSDLRAELWNLFGGLDRINTISIAPIRTRPRRTYDQVTEEFTPEGERIPFVLSDLLQDEQNRAILERFGQEAGLFRQIGVRRLGNKVSDPIQIMVTNASRPANLLDVGYGVSQALPVVVESMLVAPERLVLLQQPEVHLHPRAQAALGTLFVDLFRDSNKRFIIETHSDYIIDRVRQEIAKGQIEAEDVQILYFEKTGAETQVYPIDLDEEGNLLNPPSSYRNFFLQEEINLFSRAENN